MSPAPDLLVLTEGATPELDITIEPMAAVNVTIAPPTLQVVGSATVGPQGPPGEWTQMTQAAYDALPTKDPDILYVIVG